jgi:16S rRNA (adenine1518-N6/adenine1519-N6)-dimethyltransferase
MKETERQTRSYLMELFEQHGFHPRTDRGQNFLIDLNIVEFIVEQADLGPRDVVLEVGAGTGGMTTFLAQQAGEVVSVEVDRNMYQLAAEVTATYENVTLLNCDALKNKNRFHADVLAVVQEKLDKSEGGRLKLVANLPYNIATPIVSNLVATDLPWERIVVTIQLELGLRMTAEPRSSEYGSLAVWLQSQCYVKLLKKLPPTVFWPRPKVHSAVVRLFPNKQGRGAIHDRVFFQDFLRRLFSQRRKLLRSVLAGMYRKALSKADVDALLAAAGLSETARAEELEVATLVELSNRFRAVVGAEGSTAGTDKKKVKQKENRSAVGSAAQKGE